MRLQTYQRKSNVDKKDCEGNGTPFGSGFESEEERDFQLSLSLATSQDGSLQQSAGLQKKVFYLYFLQQWSGSQQKITRCRS